MTIAGPFDPGPWEAIATGALSDAIGRTGAMDGGIRRLCGGHLAGPAHTIGTGAGDSSTVHRGLEDAADGSVVVVDAQGGVTRAVWGSVLTIAAMERGVVGAVIDGAVRDLQEIEALGFTLYARGTCPGGPHKGFRGSIGIPVQCGGVVVEPGSIVVGDADGVTVVPASEAEAALIGVERVLRRERDWIDRIRAGESSAAVLEIQ